MNSVQVSDAEDHPGTMVLGNSQYILPEEPHLVYVVIMHHPPDWYLDKDEAKQYLHNRARIIMVGHEHVPDISKTTGVMNNEWLDIYSGATNPPEPSTLYRYSYNWIEVSLREKVGSYVLAVNVHPRVWVPERTRFDADRQRLAGRESAEFEIACPALKPAAPPAVGDVTGPATKAAASLASAAPGGPALGGTMAMDNEAAMAKLKFLFWRYLDWRQRLKVLVQADALPPSADQPVPQTMERLALEHARREGKLAIIWDKMMAYVPEAKKQANPFTKSGELGTSC